MCCAGEVVVVVVGYDEREFMGADGSISDDAP